MITIGLAGCGKTGEEKIKNEIVNEVTRVQKDMVNEKKAKKTKKVNNEDENLSKMKKWRDCLIEASTQDEAIDCHGAGDLKGYEREAAIVNTGINEWTSEDKARLIKSYSKIIQMSEEAGKK